MAFLNLNQNFKSRTVFYAAFAKLFFSLDEDNPFMFDSFLRPFHATIESLKSTGDVETFRSSKFRMTLIGLLRDLRGVLQSLTIKARVYAFMEWICGYQHLDFFEAVMKTVGSEDTEIMIPMLRFYCELICNRSARLVYDKDYNYSFYGVLIRNVASFVNGYTALMTASVKSNGSINENEVYFKRYKPIHITLSIIKFWLAGNGLALSLFTYFGAEHVSLMIHNTFKLVEGIPIKEMLSYPKFASAYFAAVEVVCTHTWYHIPTNLEFKHLEYMVRETPGSSKLMCDLSIMSRLKVWDQLL